MWKVVKWGGGGGGKRRRRLLPDDASVEEREDEVERDRTPGHKVVNPGPEVSL